ncbi:small multi-drug export protein [Candidatus Woesearchaeota archaeon]|nr:small multi-drug export protein [Candidatus Woesearchaeota archaeon]
MNAALLIVLLTLIPTLELRASIPYGLLATDAPLFLVVLLAVITNILLGFLLYELVGVLIKACRHLQWFDRFFTRVILRAQRRIKKKVERWGELGVAAFISIPLPGSGVYTAALGAELLGITRKHFYLSTIIGVLIAAALITIITITGSNLFTWVITAP